MKRKLWYITRSYSPEKSGGVLIRTTQVHLFSPYFDVQVITPAYSKSIPLKENNITRIPFFYPKKIIYLFYLLSKFGIVSDYLCLWTRKTVQYLKKHVSDNDIVFCTSGGDIASLLIGYKLKKKNSSIKYIINYHDPMVGAHVNNLYSPGVIIKKNFIEKKFLDKANLILTSADSHAKNLIIKYPNHKQKIFNNFFGYISKINCLNKNSEKERPNILHIVYGGSFNEPQKIEILAQAAEGLPNIHIHFIGNWKDYLPLHPFISTKNITFHEVMPHKDFIDFMLNKAHIGFLSLGYDYYGACVPSKLYEYINLGIPILASLPNGSAKNIIMKNNIGQVTPNKNVYTLKKALKYISLHPNILKEYKKNILTIRDDWEMKKQIQKSIDLIQKF